MKPAGRWPTRRCSRTLAILTATALGWAGSASAWGQQAASPQQADGAQDSAQDSDASIEPTRQPAVRPVPSRVGVPAPRVDVDVSVLGPMPQQTQPTLRREGEFLVDRVGRIARTPDGMQVMFIFEPSPQQEPLAPMILQPCRDLETMEDFNQQRPGEVLFTLSGQVHTYRGVNYLLPVMTRPPMEASSAAPAAAASPSQAAPASQAPDAATTQPAQDASDAAPATQQVMQQLLAQAQAPPPAAGGSLGSAAAAPTTADGGLTTNPAVQGTAPPTAPSKLLAEGQVILNRRGRIIRSPDGFHVLFAFEADSEDVSEAPLILLPCQIRQTMEDLVQERGDTLVFIASGQVYAYRGANYLLPTTMKVAIDRGNLHH